MVIMRYRSVFFKGKTHLQPRSVKQLSVLLVSRDLEKLVGIHENVPTAIPLRKNPYKSRYSYVHIFSDFSNN